MGDLTPHLYKLQKDDTLLCRKIAKDRFALDVKSGRMQHLLMSGNHKPYCLLGASRSWEIRLSRRVGAHPGEVPWFKFMTTISRPWEDATRKGETGRVDDLVRKYTDQ